MQGRGVWDGEDFGLGEVIDGKEAKDQAGGHQSPESHARCAPQPTTHVGTFLGFHAAGRAPANARSWDVRL